MICFADTDIVLNLATCNLLTPTLAVLSTTRQEVFVFRQEAYLLYRHNKEVQAKYSPEALRRALKFINGVHNISTPIDDEEHVYMSAADIDNGEQVVFSATREYTDFSVITGDKRALQKLPYAYGCGGIYSRMKGRVFCLEQILLLVIDAIGFEVVRNKVIPVRDVDNAFSQAFLDDATQPDAQAILQRRVDELRARTLELLAE